jgi:hypothetical protein
MVAGSISDAPAPRKAGHAGWSAKKLAVINSREDNIFKILSV